MLYSVTENTNGAPATMYNAQSADVVAFITAFERTKGYNYPLTATDKRKYIMVDRDHSGVFMIERATGKVYNVRGYGKRGSQAGNLWNLTQAYNTTQHLKLVK